MQSFIQKFDKREFKDRVVPKTLYGAGIGGLIGAAYGASRRQRIIASAGNVGFNMGAITFVFFSTQELLRQYRNTTDIYNSTFGGFCTGFLAGSLRGGPRDGPRLGGVYGFFGAVGFKAYEAFTRWRVSKALSGDQQQQQQLNEQQQTQQQTQRTQDQTSETNQSNTETSITGVITRAASSFVQSLSSLLPGSTKQDTTELDEEQMRREIREILKQGKAKTASQPQQTEESASTDDKRQ